MSIIIKLFWFEIGTLDSETDCLIYPPQNALSYETLCSECTYLLDNGIDMFLWIGRNAPIEFLQEIFGLDNVENDLYVRFYFLTLYSTPPGTDTNSAFSSPEISDP